MAKLDFAKGVSAVLTGTTNWARLTEKSGPDRLSEKYQVDLTLDAESIKTLEGMKILSFLEPKRKDGSKKYENPLVRLKTNQVPELFDTARLPLMTLLEMVQNCVLEFLSRVGRWLARKDSPPTLTRGSFYPLWIMILMMMSCGKMWNSLHQ